MVRTLRFHCRGQGFTPWSFRELRSRKTPGAAKKKKKIRPLPGWLLLL